MLENYYSMVLSIGTPAPDFTAKDQNNKTITLSKFRGKRVILYFYPKDDTPGCTKEACGFRDAYAGFKKKGVIVLGVSTDSVESHATFAKKYKLSFPLVADADKKIAKAYDVIGFIGGLLGTASRVTYVIDKEGVIEEVFTSVNPAEHASDLLAVFSRAH